MTQLTPPHNSEWIIAFGQGHQLQWSDENLPLKWHDMSNVYEQTPWYSQKQIQWRIKLEPVVAATYSAIFTDGKTSTSFKSLTDVMNFYEDAKDIEYTPIAYIKITITDGVAKVEIVE